MKFTSCYGCGSVKMKKIELKQISGDGWRKTEILKATEETPEYYKIIEIWCPFCGIMYNPDV